MPALTPPYNPFLMGAAIVKYFPQPLLRCRLNRLLPQVARINRNNARYRLPSYASLDSDSGEKLLDSHLHFGSDYKTHRLGYDRYPRREPAYFRNFWIWLKIKQH